MGQVGESESYVLRWRMLAEDDLGLPTVVEVETVDEEGRRQRYIGRKNPSARAAYDEEGRFIPEKYLAGLPAELRKARVRELTASRSGELGFEELPTDIAARRLGITKKGQYTQEAERRGFAHRGDYRDTARRAFRYYRIPASSSDIETVARELEKVYKKGLAAWQTGGHRPGASQSAWGYARIASVLTGGKAAYTADRKNVAAFPVRLRGAIHAQRMFR